MEIFKHLDACFILPDVSFIYCNAFLEPSLDDAPVVNDGEGAPALCALLWRTKGPQELVQSINHRARDQASVTPRDQGYERFSVLDLFIEELNRHEAEIVAFPNLYASRCLICESEYLLNLVVQEGDFARITNKKLFGRHRSSLTGNREIARHSI